jgi:hypothetical protein
MSQEKEEFQKIVQKLVDFGDDTKELQYWQEIFDDLEAEEKEKIVGILKEELEKLEKLK